MYIKNLEENVRYLETENDQLKQSKIACELKEKEMRERIIYLESIILNDSHISSVIQKLQMPTQSTSSILTTTQTINDNFTKLKKSSKPLTESSNKKRSINSNSSTTDNHGICVHIKKKCVSLEFCQQCSQKNDNDRIKFPINSK
ncbi:hypothetical protein SNEBB_010585 [Seison nebaliae]|nr:hypothetical protein SNEBB_010585 [Seison nebaliae]